MTVGQPVLISDHLNLTARSPLVGAQFVDLTDAYAPRLRQLAREATRADRRRLRRPAGTALRDARGDPDAADAGRRLVGMSTVHETIAARAAGAEVLGISLVTNLAAGITGRAAEPRRGARRRGRVGGPDGRTAGRGHRPVLADVTPEEWIAHDPDPQTAAELAACNADELRERFARALTFGTAGLRGPVRGGPDAMNVAVVLRATWAVAQVLADGAWPARRVVVGRDARHGSASFAAASAEVLAAQGFSVLRLPGAAPTPVLAFAVRHVGAAAGIQITASHNPAADNGYKVYFDGGIQIVSPTDRQIETAMAAAPGRPNPAPASHSQPTPI